MNDNQRFPNTDTFDLLINFTFSYIYDINTITKRNFFNAVINVGYVFTDSVPHHISHTILTYGCIFRFFHIFFLSCLSNSFICNMPDLQAVKKAAANVLRPFFRNKERNCDGESVLCTMGISPHLLCIQYTRFTDRCKFLPSFFSRQKKNRQILPVLLIKYGNFV